MVGLFLALLLLGLGLYTMFSLFSSLLSEGGQVESSAYPLHLRPHLLTKSLCSHQDFCQTLTTDKMQEDSMLISDQAPGKRPSKEEGFILITV